MKVAIVPGPRWSRIGYHMDHLACHMDWKTFRQNQTEEVVEVVPHHMDHVMVRLDTVKEDHVQPVLRKD